MANSESAETLPMPLVNLRYRVEGMDCSSCALKIEDAVQQLRSTEEIQVNYKAQVLELRLDEATTPRTTVEEQIRKLGYGVAPLT